MAVHVSILPGGHDFIIDGADDSILDGALRAGIPLNYGCSGGNCGLCKARLVAGRIGKTRHHDYVLTEAEKSQGYLLLCSSTALGDVEIEADVAGGAHDIPFQHITAKVKSITPLAPDMKLLHLQTPRTSRLRFLAGQSVMLSLGEEASGILPVASCPCDGRNLLFHIRRSPGNAFLDHLFNHLGSGDAVDIAGPQGEFVLHEKSPRPLLFIVFDDGFAPIQSLIEHALSLDAAEAISLYWIGSSERSIYMPNVARAWADALDNFYYAGLVAGYDLAEMAGKHEGEFNAMLHGIAEACSGMKNGDIYLSGQASAIAAAEQFFLGRGVSRAQVFAASW